MHTHIPSHTQPCIIYTAMYSMRVHEIMANTKHCIHMNARQTRYTLDL